ncbi:MAG: energy transducer TonB [Flavobacterium sp.]
MKTNQLIAILLLCAIFSCKKKETPIEPSRTPNNNIPVAIDSANTAETAIDKDNLDENKKLLLDFYRKNEKKPQVFLINNNKDTTIVCTEKTRIKISANSFAFADGSEASGKIAFSVKEFYRISDILLAKLSTTSNGNLLETGGMLHIVATSNDKPCGLKRNKKIIIEFPRKEEKKDMQLFTGRWSNETTDWQLIQNSIDMNQTFTNANVDVVPDFPGGMKKLYEFISRNINLDEEMKSGQIYTSFVIDREGNATNVKILRGLGKSIDAEVLRVMKKIPKFIPGKKDGIAVNVTYNLPIRITGPGPEEIDNSQQTRSEFKKQFEQDYNKDNFQEAGADQLTYYMFSSSSLGYINCDRFLNSNSNKIDYAFNFKDDSQTSVYMIFHSMKSILTQFSNNSGVAFKNIPSNQKVSVFAIKYFNGKPFLGTMEDVTSAKQIDNLSFRPTTLETIKTEMKKLDRFN